jgi:hypothetical protein
VPLLVIVHLAIAIACGVHAVRTGQQMYWLFILLMFPLLGSIIYALAVIAPSLGDSRQARALGGAARKALDPQRELREAMHQLEIARTPGIFSAELVSSLRIRPLAIVASTGTAYNIPGKWKSEVYCALPLTFAGPSTRGVLRPIGEIVLSSVIDMFAPSINHAVASWSA